MINNIIEARILNGTLLKVIITQNALLNMNNIMLIGFFFYFNENFQNRKTIRSTLDRLALNSAILFSMVGLGVSLFSTQKLIEDNSARLRAKQIIDTLGARLNPKTFKIIKYTIHLNAKTISISLS